MLLFAILSHDPAYTVHDSVVHSSGDSCNTTRAKPHAFFDHTIWAPIRRAFMVLWPVVKVALLCVVRRPARWRCVAHDHDVLVTATASVTV